MYFAISPDLLIRRTSDLKTEFRRRKALRGWSAITPKQIQHGWRPPSWKSIWRHISVVDDPVWTKFGSRMQSNTPITAKWSRSKPEIEFQYAVRLFFKTGSSYISVVNCDMSTKFGVLIDIDVLKAVTSTNTKPEIVLSGRGRHLEKWIWRHISAVGAPIWTKFGSLVQNNTQIMAKWSRSKPEVEFQDGGRLFFKNGSSYNLYLSRELRYVDEIWFAGRLWPSKGSDINKYETGSSIQRPRPLSWKIDMTSYFCVGRVCVSPY